jgi:3-dehydroquinate synthase
VAGSVAIKAAVVSEDAHEHGRRAILNFGHTIAHAIEAVTGYALLHGEAVAIGMAVEAELGTQLGVTEPGTADALRDALAAWGLPSEPPDVPLDDLLGAMRFDKKVRSASVKFALLRRLGAVAQGPGGSWTFSAPPEAVRAALAR